MKRHLLAFPLFGRNEGAGTCKTLPKKPFLALAGAALLLVGCQQDPVGKAPGGLEPSASSQQSGDHHDASDSGEGSGSSDSGDSGDSGSGGSGGGGSGGSGGGSGSAN